jgi:phosphate:Na+ symporter
MCNLTSEMFDGFVEVLGRPDADLSAEVTRLKGMEDICDGMLNDITAYLIQCSTHEIGRENATRIASMLRVVSEFEEATDRIYRLVKVVQRKYEKGHLFRPEHDKEIENLCHHVRTMLDLSARSLDGVPGDMLTEAEHLENRIDALRKNHNRGAMKRMQDGGDVPTEMIFTEINNHLEAVGNHGLNIVQNGDRLEAAV